MAVRQEGNEQIVTLRVTGKGGKISQLR